MTQSHSQVSLCISNRPKENPCLGHTLGPEKEVKGVT